MTTAVPPTSAAPSAPIAPTPDASAFNQFARLVRWELFLAWRRRAMVITLSSLLLVGYLLVILVELITYASLRSQEGDLAPTVGLTLPSSLGNSGSYVSYVGLLLFVVLAGALIGSEYSYSTLRLSFARGVGRGQLLAAQITAIALVALALSGVFVLLGPLTAAFSSALGVVSPVFTFTSEGLLEVILYWLAIAFNIFAYTLIAVCVGTLTRSVAGAIAGPLVYLVVEVIVGGILSALGDGPYSSPTLHTLGEIPQYFLGPNTSALEYFAGHSPFTINSATPRFDLTHALIVCLVYVVVLIGLSYLALRSRDIVE